MRARHSRQRWRIGLVACRGRVEAQRPSPNPAAQVGARAAATTRTVAVRVSSGGSGADAWYVFEPTRPRPKKAPLAIVMHGYCEYAGYDSMYELIRHTVRKGSIVIYPRWQTDVATPCPGPVDIEPCMKSSTRAIRGALAYLRARPKRRVQPDLERTSYFGFSFGGIITANLTNRYRKLHLPKPRAIWLEDPHDGGLDGPDEPAVDDSLRGHSRDGEARSATRAPEGVIAEPDQGGLAGSCNAIFPKLRHIPKRNKDLVLTRPDAHGTPALAAPHGVCAARQGAAPTPTTGTSAGRPGMDCGTARTQRDGLPLRARRHPPAPLERQVERRRADRTAEDPGRRADPALSCVPAVDGRLARGIGARRGQRRDP